MSKHNKCLVCDAERLKKLSDFQPKHELVKCSSCGFVFMEDIPTLEELQAHYEKYSYDAEGYLSPLTIKSYQKLLDEFEPYRKTGNLIDVGCGRGYFLLEAKKRGWKVYGTEYSDKAVELCTKEGIDMKLGQLNPKDFAGIEFDVATSFEVFEHIHNPNEELNNIKALLRKGGLFYCTTPNFDSLMRYYLKADYDVITYPEHLSYYNRSTLTKLATQNGFRKVKFLSTGISLTRLKTSKGKSDEGYIAAESSDEKLRQAIDSKWYNQVAKDLVNGVFSIFNWGMTLKGYYEKR